MDDLDLTEAKPLLLTVESGDLVEAASQYFCKGQCDVCYG